MMLRILLVLLFVALGAADVAASVRIKDITAIQGVRNNQLVGYMAWSWASDGTGRQPAQLAVHRAVLAIDARSDGCQHPPGSNARTKNIAAVLVTADLPAFAGRRRAHRCQRCPRSAMPRRYPAARWS